MYAKKWPSAVYVFFGLWSTLRGVPDSFFNGGIFWILFYILPLTLLHLLLSDSTVSEDAEIEPMSLALEIRREISDFKVLKKRPKILTQGQGKSQQKCVFLYKSFAQLLAAVQ
jgi:hypothetical protein